MREAGIDIIPALPTGAIRSLFSRADLRNHRKIIVIDHHLAYTGSQNLVDPQFFNQDANVGLWIDAMARISGPGALTLSAVFEFDWAIEKQMAFIPPPALPQLTKDASEGLLQVVPSGPDLQPDAIHELLLSAIYSSQRELIMTTPYFVPDESMITALITAALRGVNVILIVPAHNDSRMVRFASASHYEALMSAGVSIALFEGGLLHTKSMTIDDTFCIFGSVNLDIRSLWLNSEISLFIYDAPFCQRLKQLQNNYLENARFLELDKWIKRPRWKRFVENTFRLGSPLL